MKNNRETGSGRILRFERDASFFVKRGDAKRAQNDPVSAISMYNEALAMDPLDLDTRLSAAEVLTDMSRFNDSDKLLIPYMHEDAEFCKEAYSIVGFNLIGMGELEGAKLCFDHFFDLTDEVSERTDAILDALDYIDSMTVDAPKLSDAAELEREARLYEAQKAFDAGEFEKSEGILKALLEERPEDPKLLYHIALACLCGFKTRECDRYLQLLLEKEPENWAALGMKLMCAKAFNNEIECTKLAKKLETCDSSDPEELLRVNGSLMESGCLDAAEKIAKKLVKILPYDAFTNHRLGVCYMKKGEFRKAAEIYGKLLRIDKNDRIARYFKNGCLEAAEDPGCAFAKQQFLIQYQLPFAVIMDDVKDLLDGSKASTQEDIKRRWEQDPEFRDMARWSFTLREFNITHAMIAVLQMINDESSERLLRELVADIDSRDAVVNEALGALKRMGAAEPFFAVSEGRLLEGRVNIVDLSDMKIPKGYRDIFPRFHRSAKELLSTEVISVASGIVERFIMCCIGNFKPISPDQSAALSAAVEFLACERCGIIARDDICERYGITEKRLSNAVNRLIKTFVLSGSEDQTPPEHDGGETL